MSQPWYSPQTANHLIWAVTLVLLALIALAGWWLTLRARAAAQTMLGVIEQQRREAEAQRRDG